MNAQLLIGTAMIVGTVCLHVVGLLGIARFIRGSYSGRSDTSSLHTIRLLVGTIWAITILHLVEAWLWAVVFQSLGEFESIHEALYFSIATATTVGYGDVVLSKSWQLLGTFEAMSGMILFGVSTAFLLGVVKTFFDTSPPGEDQSQR